MMVNQQTWGILVDLCWTSWFTSTPGFMVIRFSELVNGVCKSTNLTGGAPCGFKIKPTANPLMNYPSWLRSGYPQIVIIYIYIRICICICICICISTCICICICMWIWIWIFGYFGDDLTIREHCGSIFPQKTMMGNCTGTVWKPWEKG
jgi:hypothetical protein